MSFITLEDINTWILKYMDNTEPIIHSAPLVTANHSLYRGNTNDITNLITLPSDGMEYTISYQGKPLTNTLYIPETFEDDEIRLRITTKSYEPYIGLDIHINVPVTTKEITSLDDLNTYSYGEVTVLSNLTGSIVNDIHLVGGTIEDCNLTFNGNVILENMEITGTQITNNQTLTVKDCNLTPTNDKFLIDNNSILNVEGCESEEAQNLILNKNTLNLTGNNLSFDSTRNYPCIHSETYPNITGNTFTYDTSTEGYGICIIRTNTINTSHFLSQNHTVYDCTYTNNETTYNVSGEGIAYCLIDDDIIKFIQLEVDN